MIHALLIALGLASAPAMPDPHLTPGAVATTDRATICAPGYDKAHRVWHDKRGTLAKYGIPWSERGQYEDDDRVPVCGGGDSASPLNHWPEKWADAHQKDRLEWYACRQVCAGRVSVGEAQSWFLGDWHKQLWRIGDDR